MHFDGPIDSLVDVETGEHLLATLNEALSNIAGHAEAHHVDVYVSAGPDLWLRVVDDGQGFTEETDRRSGLDNLAVRAKRLGGSLEVDGNPGEGTTLEWSVPIPSIT